MLTEHLQKCSDMIFSLHETQTAPSCVCLLYVLQSEANSVISQCLTNLVEIYIPAYIAVFSGWQP